MLDFYSLTGTNFVVVYGTKFKGPSARWSIFPTRPTTDLHTYVYARVCAFVKRIKRNNL